MDTAIKVKYQHIIVSSLLTDRDVPLYYGVNTINTMCVHVTLVEKEEEDCSFKPHYMSRNQTKAAILTKSKTTFSNAFTMWLEQDQSE